MKTRLRSIVLLVLAFAVAMTGCAAAGNQSESIAYDMAMPEEAPAAEPMMEKNAEWAEEMDDEAMVNSGGSAADVAMPRMIIYNADLDLVVKDTDATEQAIISLAESLGGYVANSSSYNYGEGLRTINISVRIPAEKFQDAMASMRDMAMEVRSDSISSSDVTQEYVDLESRLKALEVKAEKLEELMDAAEDTEAVLDVYAELSSTQAEIEQVKGRMRYLERLSAMATIDVHLEPDELSQPVELPGWHPEGTVRRAFESLVGAFQFLVDALIWIIIWVLPIFGFIGLVVFGFIKLLGLVFGKRRRRRKAEKQAETETEEEAAE